MSKNEVFTYQGLYLCSAHALIAHYIVGTEQTMVELRTTTVWPVFSGAIRGLFRGYYYVFSYRYSLVSTLSLAAVVWVLCASMLLIGWTCCTKCG
ncbi:GlpM family protein [Vibrio chagasii]|nr:GlpM family protein [Vibrio chagasii]